MDVIDPGRDLRDGGGSDTTQDRVGPDGSERRDGATPLGEERVAERVDASMLRSQEAGGDGTCDPARLHAEPDELRVVDDAVLPLGDTADASSEVRNVDLARPRRSRCTLRTLSVVNVHLAAPQPSSCPS